MERKRRREEKMERKKKQEKEMERKRRRKVTSEDLRPGNSAEIPQTQPPDHHHLRARSLPRRLASLPDGR